MKYFFSSLFFLFVFTMGFSQTIVPEVVEKSFLAKYSQVESPFWELREGAIVAMFADEDGLKKVFFEEDGVWLETRTRLSEINLPLGIREFIDQNYKDAVVSYAGKVERPTDIVYRVESELLSAVVIKLLNEDGVLLESDRIELSDIEPIEMIRHELLPNQPIKPLSVGKEE